MQTMQPRMKKAAHTKIRIIKAAQELFRTRSYSQVGIRDIAQAAQVSVGVVYYHFPSKDEILLACFDGNDGLFGEELKRIAVSEMAVCEKIRCFLMRVMLPTVQADGKALTRYRMFELKLNSLPESLLYRNLEIAVRHAQKTGELTQAISAGTITGHILTVLRGVMYEWCVTEGEEPVAEYAARHIAFALRAFQK